MGGHQCMVCSGTYDESMRTDTTSGLPGYRRMSMTLRRMLWISYMWFIVMADCESTRFKKKCGNVQTLLMCIAYVQP